MDDKVYYVYVERMIIDDTFVKPKIINDKEILEEYYKVLKENCGVTIEEAFKKVKKRVRK